MLKKSKKTLVALAAATSIFANTACAAELGAFTVKLQGGYALADSSLKSSAVSTDGKTTGLIAKLTNKELRGFTGGIGFGYVASEDIVTDLTVSYDTLKSKITLDNAAITQMKNDNISAMMNAYYGFNSNNQVSPYVMLGFGLGMSKSKATLPTGGMSIDGTAVMNNATPSAPLTGTLQSKNTNYFAGQAGFGLAITTMKAVSLDIGYRIANTQVGKFTTAIHTTPAGGTAALTTLTLKPQNRIKQSVIAGLSVAF